MLSDEQHISYLANRESYDVECAEDYMQLLQSIEQLKQGKGTIRELVEVGDE